MEKLLGIALALAPTFLVGCTESSATVVEMDCTVSHKTLPYIDTYECGSLQLENRDIWDDVTVEHTYRMQVLEGGYVLEAEFLKSPQSIRFL